MCVRVGPRYSNLSFLEWDMSFKTMNYLTSSKPDNVKYVGEGKGAGEGEVRGEGLRGRGRGSLGLGTGQFFRYDIRIDTN